MDEFYTEDFESYTPPFLTGDWETETSNGTVSIVSQKDGAGQVLRIFDDDADSDYAYALRLFDDYSELNDEPFFLYWDYYGESGALVFEWLQVFGIPEFFAYFPVDGPSIEVDAPSKEIISCNYTLLPDTWYSIQLYIDPVAREISLGVDGEATSCSDIEFVQPSGDDQGFMFIGLSSEGFGGLARFDNLRMFRPLDAQ